MSSQPEVVTTYVCQVCHETFQRERDAKGRLRQPRKYCLEHTSVGLSQGHFSQKVERKSRQCRDCQQTFELSRQKSGAFSQARSCPDCLSKKRPALLRTDRQARCVGCGHLFERRSKGTGYENRSSCYVCVHPEVGSVPKRGHSTFGQRNWHDNDLAQDYKAAKLPELPELPRSQWLAEGACFADPELWFSDILQDQLAAQQACLSCPVLQQCSQLTKANPDRYGVWAGTLPTQTEIAA